MMTRRQAIKTTALASVALAVLPSALAQTNSAAPAAPTTDGPFTLPPLPYASDALEPYIDAHDGDSPRQTSRRLCRQPQ